MPQPAAVPGTESTQLTGVPEGLSPDTLQEITKDLQELQHELRPESGSPPAPGGPSPEQRG